MSNNEIIPKYFPMDCTLLRKEMNSLFKTFFQVKIQPNNSHFTNMFETLHPQKIKKDTWVLSWACLCFFLTRDLLKPSAHLARNSRSQFGLS